MRRLKADKRFWTMVVAAKVVKIAVVALLLTGCVKKELQMQSVTAAVDTLSISVMTTGTIQPVEKVDVGTQVSGIIQEIFVDFNSTVKAGDIMAQLDTQTLNENVSKANASLQSAQSDLAYAQATYDRTRRLHDAKAATLVDLDAADNRLAQARTALVNARANLKQSQVNLGYAKITSPIDGVVMNRAVEQGQTVAASFNTPTLFTIAQDLTKMQVEAAVDEADIGKVRTGQQVTFEVDAYPDDNFAGTVQQVRIEPITTSNVVTYTVIIEAPNPDLKLFPGMTASVYIITEGESGVAVPVEALFFEMPQDVAKHLDVDEYETGDIRPMDASTSDGAPAMGGTPVTAGAAATPQVGKTTVLWVRTGDSWMPREVTAGLQDGVNAIIMSGLKAGEEVMLSAEMVKVEKAGGAAKNPFMPQRRRRR